uniref:Uncharacterized protein n=1 Tax=Rhizophora mucronata TaxID=61149 RepID=A0A2P2Q5E5_RHIMU
MHKSKKTFLSSNESTSQNIFRYCPPFSNKPHEINEEVVTYKPRSLRATVAVINTNERGIMRSLHLAVILNNLIGLNDSEGEVTITVLLKVPGPEMGIAEGSIVIVIKVIILVHTGI